MKRISLVVAIAFALVSSTYTQAPAVKLTAAQKQEYLRLLEAGAGETAVQAWATRSRLQIVKQGTDTIIIPEQTAETPTVQEAANCDHTKCDTGVMSTAVKGWNGKVLGYQDWYCTAKSCTWIRNQQGRWERVCSNYDCKKSGPVIYKQ